MNKSLVILSLIFMIFISGCSTKGTRVYKSYSSDAQAKGKKKYSALKMNPYTVRGIRYYPKAVRVGDKFKGHASWYGPQFHGKLTSNGETYDMHDMTAAHKTFPMNTIVKVTNNLNGLSTIVRINDRGPFIGTRLIDLSKKAAKKIDMIGTGTAPVTLEIVDYDRSIHKTHKIKAKKIKRVTIKKPIIKSVPIDVDIEPIVNSKTMNYALQIASFDRINGALAVQEKYNNTDGYETIIKDTTTNGISSYKVWLIGFSSKEEAREYRAEGNFENSFIVKED